MSNYAVLLMYSRDRDEIIYDKWSTCCKHTRIEDNVQEVHELLKINTNLSFRYINSQLRWLTKIIVEMFFSIARTNSKYICIQK